MTTRNELLEEADPPVNVDARDENGWTSLMWAAANGHDEVVANLLANCADFYVPNAKRETPLMLVAASNGHYDVMNCSATAFLRAAESGQADAIALLSSYHTEVSSRNPQGRLAMLLAAANNRVDVVKEQLYLDECATIDNAPLIAILSSLLKADYMNMVQVLLQVIEDVNAVDQDGQTPLMIAARHHRVHATIALLGKGADSSLRNNADKSRMDIAIEFGHYDVVLALQDDDKRNTKKLLLSLMAALEEAQAEVVPVLC